MLDLVRRLEARRDLPFALVRVYLGVGLFVKGIYFIQNREYLTGLLEDSGDLWWVPAAVAHYVIVAHLTGGISIALGFLTRAGAAVQLPALIGAVFHVHLPKLFSAAPRENFEFSALVLFLLLLIFVWGPGPLSVDARLARER
jgi:uncharacterized membrane protein YphA (DoxX/SURF4 family)